MLPRFMSPDPLQRAAAELDAWKAWARTLPPLSRVWIDADAYAKLDAAVFARNIMMGQPVDRRSDYCISIYTIKVRPREARVAA